MSNFNEAMMQFLMQAQRQGGAAGADGFDTNFQIADGKGGFRPMTPAEIRNVQPTGQNVLPPSPQPSAQPAPQAAMGGMMMEPRQAMAPQNVGAAGQSGAQMPPGILASLIQRLLGIQPQGQHLNPQGGLGQVAPDWRPQ